jgi:hypothetical protein
MKFWSFQGKAVYKQPETIQVLAETEEEAVQVMRARKLAECLQDAPCHDFEVEDTEVETPLVWLLLMGDTQSYFPSFTAVSEFLTAAIAAWSSSSPPAVQLQWSENLMAMLRQYPGQAVRWDGRGEVGMVLIPISGRTTLSLTDARNTLNPPPATSGYGKTVYPVMPAGLTRKSPGGE